VTRLIKYYPNRKLYDTADRRYITLQTLGELVRHGEEVQVVENATGADLTAATLAQSISGQEKRQQGLFPQRMLAEWMQAGESQLARLRQALTESSLLGQLVDEEVARRIERLVTQGDFSAEEGARLIEKLRTPPGETAPPLSLENALQRVLAQQGLPSRSELLHLMDELDALIARLG
jgi:polyhydroxyalkanoate synthesis repressor PhaR